MIKSTNPIILTFSGHFIPGYRGGGPIRTIASLVEALGDEFNFKIVTLDRDLGCNEPYLGIKVNAWQKVGKAEVLYISPEKIGWGFIRHMIMHTPHDILYLNSFFSPYFGILPITLRRLGLIPQKPAIIAPRGQFSGGALNLKAFKKQIYINFVKMLNLHKNLIWQVSSAHEKEDLYTVFKNGRKSASQLTTIIAPNLPDIEVPEITRATVKEPGRLKIVFLSRISPKKNLDGALKMITGLIGRITFNIFGPIEDVTYWESCQKIIEALPANIQVKYQGMVAHDEVIRVMSDHDLFFLPTHGENFGHVIIEALAAGCPILISDQTPWRDLEKEGVGWDLPLNQSEQITAILQRFTDMDRHELASFSNRACEYAQKKMMDVKVINQNRDLFLNSIQR